MIFRSSGEELNARRVELGRTCVIDVRLMKLVLCNWLRS